MILVKANTVTSIRDYNLPFLGTVGAFSVIDNKDLWKYRIHLTCCTIQRTVCSDEREVYKFDSRHHQHLHKLDQIRSHCHDDIIHLLADHRQIDKTPPL